ncbi:MAG: ABC transporter ATP-binding protein [Bryobacteraceae bacterium]|nr:MAG: ABC transporter ATP-binding protein [Bryobacteraceae bacterium]
MSSDVVIRARRLTKEFLRDSFHIVALKDVDLDVRRGEYMALMGPSGSGKSTLLHLIAAMDRPTAGEIEVLGANVATMADSEMAKWRNRHIGFVFQSFNLIPVLTALENVELPLKLTHLKKGERIQHAATALKLVGLGDRMDHYPRQLSGGQEQRVAIARAIVTDPDILLCDEPTGNLDARSANEVLELLRRLNQEFGKTIVMVTHDPHAAHYATHIRYIDKGELLPEGKKPEDWS